MLTVNQPLWLSLGWYHGGVFHERQIQEETIILNFKTGITSISKSGRAQIKVRFVPIRKTVFLTTKLSPLQTILWFYSRILDEFSKYSDILNSILTCIIRYHVSRAPGSRFWKSSLGDSNIQPVWEPLSDDIRGLTTTIDT